MYIPCFGNHNKYLIWRARSQLLWGIWSQMWSLPFTGPIMVYQTLLMEIRKCPRFTEGRGHSCDFRATCLLWDLSKMYKFECQNLNFRDRWIFPTWLGDAQWGHSSPSAFSGVLSLQSLTVRNGTSKKGMGWVSQMVNFWPWFLGGHRITVCFNHRRM